MKLDDSNGSRATSLFEDGKDRRRRCGAATDFGQQRSAPPESRLPGGLVERCLGSAAPGWAWLWREGGTAVPDWGQIASRTLTAQSFKVSKESDIVGSRIPRGPHRASPQPLLPSSLAPSNLLNKAFSSLAVSTYPVVRRKLFAAGTFVGAKGRDNRNDVGWVERTSKPKDAKDDFIKAAICGQFPMVERQASVYSPTHLLEATVTFGSLVALSIRVLPLLALNPLPDQAFRGSVYHFAHDLPLALILVLTQMVSLRRALTQSAPQKTGAVIKLDDAQVDDDGRQAKDHDVARGQTGACSSRGARDPALNGGEARRLSV
ncbi:hypothetical protein BDK51DRAFT_51799 [Blyttiomyces helicus]|uniref:Uncharacterized protein n=1 Tax=Blyttiomyces helicus TaxID=388810 RepID=A0A4P9W7S4_9FUNG|nr:hypothetical protein BDK51DRAFT_51799 [Blyttiomyces helicus]|eukprot:RKO88539.1 hypothetical protein BDK51DRAFT_51799 [Blyttiomyces helicus]